MDIHKPKPWHNWREFLKEYVIIVIGVSTALAAEQAVEWFHWRQQVQLARESIAAELTDNIRHGIERVELEQCLEARLDHIAVILETAAQTGVLPPVADIGNSPYRPWPHSAWDSVVNSPVAAHFPRQMIRNLGSTYAQVQLEAQNNQAENEAWTDLNALVGPGGRMNPSTETAMRLALGRARDLVRNLALDGGQLARRSMQLDLPYTDQQRKDMVTGLDMVTVVDRVRKECATQKAIVPPHYGQAPAAEVTAKFMQNWRKNPPYAPKGKP